MNDKLFFYDLSVRKKYLYMDLVSYLNSADCLSKYIYTTNFFEIFVSVILGIIYEKEIYLLDYDLSADEINKLEVKDLNKKYFVKIKHPITLQNLLEKIKNSKHSRINLYTSGTTGQPKRISHDVKNIIRTVKIDDSKKNNIWGFAYNPTHIAGIQVFFQALFNLNPIVNLFGLARVDILDLIDKFNISHISATPTFFRLLLPITRKFYSVKRISYGGERFDNSVAKELTTVFPNAKMLNIYASTEAGTLLASSSDVFEIKNEFKDLIKISNNELLVHVKLIGDSQLFAGRQKWYHTGDIVEFIDNSKLKFRIVGRKNEMINIGGYKVNPLDVESILNEHDDILGSRVYAKKNSILGAILIADILAKNNLTEKSIRDYLNGKIQPYKIPRLINFVDKLDKTRTGKLRR